MSTVPVRLRSVSYFWVGYLRTWKGDIGITFIAPVLYLVSIGIGVGSLVNHGHALKSLGGTYLDFVAPALLATNSMQMGVINGTYGVWSACNQWTGAYRSMQASPLSIDDMLFGHMAWFAFRLLIGAVAYLAISAAFGTVHSFAALGGLVLGPLVGLAFTLPIGAYAVTARIDAPFTMIFRLLMVPLFLFSGTFFSLSQLPLALRYVAYALPLWHGVQLSRVLYAGSLHGVGWGSALGDLVYLLALTGGAYLVARHTYARKLSR